MVATPSRDEKKFDSMSIFSRMSGARAFRKRMKEMGERHRNLMKKNYRQSAVKELKQQANISSELNRQLRAYDHDRFQANIRKLNEGMQNTSELNEALQTLANFDSNIYQDLVSSINIEPPSIDLTPSSETLAAMSKVSYSGVDTDPLVDIPEPIVQPRGPKVSEASDEKLISELVARGRFVVCPECGEVDRAENIELVSAGEDATTEYRVVCRQCGSSDIGYQ